MVHMNELVKLLNKMEEALRKIAKWHDEFPETDKYWDNEKLHKMSFGAAYGSDGERDYMRAIAKEALDYLDSNKET